jgi:hypothetical protein
MKRELLDTTDSIKRLAIFDPTIGSVARETLIRDLRTN